MWRGQSESRRGEQEKRSGRFIGAVETIEELAGWRRLQQKKLKTLGLPNRKECPQHHKVSNWPGRQCLVCQKEQNHLSNHEMKWERAKVGSSCTLARKTRI